VTHEELLELISEMQLHRSELDEAEGFRSALDVVLVKSVAGE